MASKYSDLFIDNATATQKSNFLNISKGGLEGHIPQIGKVVDGTTYENYIASTPYVSQDVIAKVLTTPKFFDLMPTPEILKKIWVSLFEEHPKSITGFNSTLNVETDELEIGGTNEFLQTPKDVKRSRTTVTLEIPEKMNKAVAKFIDMCIRYGIKDPIVKRPLASQYVKSVSEISGGWTPDYYSGSVIYIEPDVTRLAVVDAWLQVQVFFKTTGDRTGKRNLSAGGDSVSLSIETAGITMVGENVIEFAGTLLPNIVNLYAIPDTDYTLPTDGVAADLKA